MPFMLREMKELTNGHTVAELMIIFSFAHMVEVNPMFGPNDSCFLSYANFSAYLLCLGCIWLWNSGCKYLNIMR